MELHTLILCVVKSLNNHFQCTLKHRLEDLTMFKWGESHQFGMPFVILNGALYFTMPLNFIPHFEFIMSMYCIIGQRNVLIGSSVSYIEQEAC